MTANIAIRAKVAKTALPVVRVRLFPSIVLSSPRFHMTMLASCAPTSCFVRPTSVRQKIGGRMEKICDLHNCSCTPVSYSNLDLHHAALFCPAEGMMEFPAMRGFWPTSGGQSHTGRHLPPTRVNCGTTLGPGKNFVNYVPYFCRPLPWRAARWVLWWPRTTRFFPLNEASSQQCERAHKVYGFRREWRGGDTPVA